MKKQTDRTGILTWGFSLLVIFSCVLFSFNAERIHARFERLFGDEPRVFEEIPQGCAFVAYPKDSVPQNVFNDGPVGGGKVEMRVVPFHAPKSADVAILTPGDYPKFGYVFRIANRKMWVIGPDGLIDPKDGKACP